MRVIDQIFPAITGRRDPARLVDGTDSRYRVAPVDVLRLSWPMRRRINQFRRRPVEVRRDGSRRLTVLVLGRERDPRVGALIPPLCQNLDAASIRHRILVVEQAWGKPLNRGALANAGVRLTAEVSDYFCFHDVGFIPRSADYRWCNDPLRVVGQLSGADGGPLDLGQADADLRPGAFGGVCLVDKATYMAIHGHSNQFWGGYLDGAAFMIRLLAGGAVPVIDTEGCFEASTVREDVDGPAGSSRRRRHRVEVRLDRLRQTQRTLFNQICRGADDPAADGVETVDFEVVAREAEPLHERVVVSI